MDYLQSSFCQARSQSQNIIVRYYNDENNNRTLRQWFGRFNLANQNILYNNSNKSQEICMTCDSFDSSMAFVGGTCEGALKQYGKELSNNFYPQFTFNTTAEFGTFIGAASYEYTTALWPTALIFGFIFVAMVVVISLLMIQNK